MANRVIVDEDILNKILDEYQTLSKVYDSMMSMQFCVVKNPNGQKNIAKKNVESIKADMEQVDKSPLMIDREEYIKPRATKGDNYLYHITPKKNIEDIIAHGLKINSKRGGVTINSADRKGMWNHVYGCIPLFLTSNPTVVVDTMLTREYSKKRNWTILKVNVNLLRCLGGFHSSEFIVLEDIDPSRIELLCSLDEWVAASISYTQTRGLSMR